MIIPYSLTSLLLISLLLLFMLMISCSLVLILLRLLTSNSICIIVLASRILALYTISWGWKSAIFHKGLFAHKRSLLMSFSRTASSLVVSLQSPLFLPIVSFPQRMEIYWPTLLITGQWLANSIFDAY